MNDFEAKQEAKRDRLLAKADRAQSASEAAYKRSHDLTSGIPMGQPILVGHHSEKRHRRTLDMSWAAMGRSVEEGKRAEELARRAAAVGTGGISSDDPEAVVKLKEKLAKMEANQDAMKRANKAYRLSVKMGINGKDELDLDDLTTVDAIANKTGFDPNGDGFKMAIKWKPEYSWEKGPFHGYPLTNNNANIRRVKARIVELQNAPTETVETEYVSFKITESVEDNRVQIFFDRKPDADIRRHLKQAGFRWAPTVGADGAWQRHLNSAGRYAAANFAVWMGSPEVK